MSMLLCLNLYNGVMLSYDKLFVCVVFEICLTVACSMYDSYVIIVTTSRVCWFLQ